MDSRFARITQLHELAEKVQAWFQMRKGKLPPSMTKRTLWGLEDALSVIDEIETENTHLLQRIEELERENEELRTGVAEMQEYRERL